MVDMLSVQFLKWEYNPRPKSSLYIKSLQHYSADEKKWQTATKTATIGQDASVIDKKQFNSISML